MKLSRRDRRDWQVIFWVILVSAVVGGYRSYATSKQDAGLWDALMGVTTSLAIATPIVLFEIKSARVDFMRGMRRLPLVVYFAIKVAFYFVVIVGGLLGIGWLFSGVMPEAFSPIDMLRDSLGFAVGMAVFGNLFFELGGLLGFATLRSLVTGRYVQPRAERKTFLLIDMKDSTSQAERLGPIRFHELLNDFFRDISHAALECEAEIHKYVGDEAILTWPGEAGFEDGASLRCPFLVRDMIERHRARYLERYGAMPEFRAALHYGEIVAGEIGDLRREIAYVGDTLNVAARLLDAAKEVGREVLVSNDLLQRAKVPPDLKIENLPTLAVRGWAAPLGIAALARA